MVWTKQVSEAASISLSIRYMAVTLLSVRSVGTCFIQNNSQHRQIIRNGSFISGTHNCTLHFHVPKFDHKLNNPDTFYMWPVNPVMIIITKELKLTSWMLCYSCHVMQNTCRELIKQQWKQKFDYVLLSTQLDIVFFNCHKRLCLFNIAIV